MSLIEAYRSIQERISNWHTLSHPEKQQLMIQAHALYGKPFRQALYHLQSCPHQISIRQSQKFIVIQVKDKKQILFIQRTHTHCTCQGHWNMCVGQSVPYNCMHQILYDLWVKIFAPEGIKIKHEGIITKNQQFSEMMSII